MASKKGPDRGQSRKRGRPGQFASDKVSAFDNAMMQFSRAAKILKLTKNQIAVVKEPRRVTEVRLPVRMDDAFNIGRSETGFSCIQTHFH